MRLPLIATLLLLAAQTQAPKEAIEGRVLRAGTREPISDVLITLTAPPAATTATNLAPDAAARLTDQVASLTESGNRLGVSQQAIDSAIDNARRNAGGAAGRQLTALTDSSGHFSFRDLPPGRYTIRAEKEGFFAPPLNGNSSTQITKTITLQDGKAAEAQDLLMVKGAVISGRIRDPNNQPISGVNVSVFRVSYTNGRKIWTSVNSKATDDRGEYRIFWLTPGDYYVGIIPRILGAIPGPQDSWSRTFFPGATEPADAQTIELKDGIEAQGTDITIRTGNTTTYKISGTAINSFARPNPTTGAVDRSIASFVLAPRDPGVLDSINPPSVVNALPVASRQNGEFELRNIRPGAYDLYPLAPVLLDPAPAVAGATAAPGGTLPPASAITSVQIINGQVLTTQVVNGQAVTTTRRQPTSRNPIDVSHDITDLRIVVNAGFPLSGEVLVNGTSSPAIKPESIRMNIRNLDNMPQSFAGLVGTVSVDSSGKFAVQSVPESRYSLQVNGLPTGAYVADIRQAGASVMDNGFVVDASASPIQVVIESVGATVQGTVQTAEGKPAATATVVLVPPPARRQSALLYRNATTDDEGKFTLRSVPPGQYTIFAWESIPPTAWQNAEYLLKFEGRGRAIIVSANAVSEVQLNLIPSEDRR